VAAAITSVVVALVPSCRFRREILLAFPVGVCAIAAFVA